MIPLLTSLAASLAPQLAQRGMDLLSGIFKGAVDEGTEKITGLIKEKTGIDVHDIAENRLTEEQWVQLKQFEMEYQEQILDVRKSMILAEVEKERLRVEDSKNARETQTQRDKNDDQFVRRFTYYYAAGITILTFVFIFSVIFVGPKESTDARWRIIDTVLGFLLGVGLSAIIQFYFGSSKSSQDKSEHIMDLSDRLGKKEAAVGEREANQQAF
jgi:hypothetical protein